MRSKVVILPFILLLGVFLSLFSGCGKPVAEDSTVDFTVKGVVHEVKDEGRTLVIAHEEMPGYMPAMVMPFNVRDYAESAELAPGDEILFRFQVKDNKSWIESIQKTGKTQVVSPVFDAESAIKKMLAQGQTLPDYSFLNEKGDVVKLSDFRGKPVALTFIFTRCPVPEFCPTMMRNFGEVSERLERDPGPLDDWQLLTISFDPKNDSPEKIRNYGETFGQDEHSSHWMMLTAEDMSIIESITANVGLLYKETNGSFAHNLRTVVLDRNGRIVRSFTDSDWEPDELIKELKKL